MLADRDACGGSFDNAVCINCAVEESTVSERPGARIMPHDEFVRDHIKSSDVLVLSIGGNDIALRPSPLTICNMAALAKVRPYRP